MLLNFVKFFSMLKSCLLCFLNCWMYPRRETVFLMPGVVAAVSAAPYGDLLLARAKRGECLTSSWRHTPPQTYAYTVAHLVYTD